MVISFLNQERMDAMKSEKTEKLLVTPTEACQMLGVGRTTMYAWIKEEKIPVVKFPDCRKIYISRETLNQLISDNTVPASDD